MEHRLPPEAASHNPQTRFDDEGDDLGARTISLRPTSPSAKRDGPAAPPGTPAVPLSQTARAFLDKLLHFQLLGASVLDSFLRGRGPGLAQCDTVERVGQALVQAGLLTSYQLDRVFAGTTYGLVLGNYRVLEGLGSGGMGIVFQAEHCLMKRRVAVKVLPVDDDLPAALRQRFYAEMRVLAELSHAHVVMAYDAGEVLPPDPTNPGLIYLVMELVDGGDLEQHVMARGRCGITEACTYIRQAASGLQAAHDRHLIHRDIKPSNILLTRAGQAKLVDFGLARQFCSRLTDPRALLGSIEFMAPEQSHDPSNVGKEADIYGLGATLFWLLTGEAPYPFTRSVGAALRTLQQDPPRRARSLRPDIPPALDNLLDLLLARNPARRPPSPLAVMNALTPFLVDEPALALLTPGASKPEVLLPRARGDEARDADGAPSGPRRRVLIVDDEAGIRVLHRMILQQLGCECVEVCDGTEALRAADGQNFDLILLDRNLPDVDGYEVCRRFRDLVPDRHLKIIIVSGCGDQNDLSEALPRGADDYVPKPFEPRQLKAKVQHAFRLKDAQERTQLLAEQLLLTNQQLQHSLEARHADVRQAHDALLFAMAKMAESRDGETAGHLRRLQCYTEVLAKQVAGRKPWAGLVDDRFLEQLERCVPLHDIGKIGLPDEVLLKTTALTPAERALLETHPLIGDRILQALGREHGTALEFLGTARAIVRHHHERFDGQGYPDRLGGDAIPASARLVAVADVYDALRRRRVHKAAMPHADAIHILLEKSPGQFDPSLLDALDACADVFEQIYRDISE